MHREWDTKTWVLCKNVTDFSDPDEMNGRHIQNKYKEKLPLREPDSEMSYTTVQ